MALAAPISSCRCLWRSAARSTARSGRSGLRVAASTAWDPEGLFKSAPAEGIIERKLFQQQISGDKEFGRKMEEFAFEQAKELQKKREARTPPTDPLALAEYFLDTEAPEMEFEVARCRPFLTPAFFADLDRRIGLERFSTMPDEERLAELTMLREYLNEGVEAVEKAAQSLAAPQERLKKLLEAKDKKAVLLEMAAANEVDRSLIDLLDQNIAGATAAKQDQAAEFMKKVKLAAMRFVTA